MLVSGDQAVVEQFTPTLSGMTGKLLNLGDREGKAAAVKLMGNCFLVTLTVGLSETLALAKSMDLAVSDVAGLFDMWNPGAMLPARLKRMASGDHNQPSWELSMARKDTQLFINEADKAGVHLAILPAIAAEMDSWIAKGHGNNDWTVIGSNSVPKQ
jgi:3-hydroxyisobutyrate dehydrogenase